MAQRHLHDVFPNALSAPFGAADGKGSAITLLPEGDTRNFGKAAEQGGLKGQQENDVLGPVGEGCPWDTDLNSTFIAAKDDQALTGADNDLVGYQTFSEGAGSIAADSGTGGANNQTGSTDTDAAAAPASTDFDLQT